VNQKEALFSQRFITSCSSSRRSGTARYHTDFTCHPSNHTFIHRWNEPCLYCVAAEHHRTALWLVVISHAAEGRRLSSPGRLGEILSTPSQILALPRSARLWSKHLFRDADVSRFKKASGRFSYQNRSFQVIGCWASPPESTRCLKKGCHPTTNDNFNNSCPIPVIFDTNITA